MPSCNAFCSSAATKPLAASLKRAVVSSGLRGSNILGGTTGAIVGVSGGVMTFGAGAFFKVFSTAALVKNSLGRDIASSRPNASKYLLAASSNSSLLVQPWVLICSSLKKPKGFLGSAITFLL